MKEDLNANADLWSNISYLKFGDGRWLCGISGIDMSRYRKSEGSDGEAVCVSSGREVTVDIELLPRNGSYSRATAA